MPVYKKMWDFMNGRKHVYVPTYDEGIQRVREKKGKIYSPDSFYMIYIFDHVWGSILKVTNDVSKYFIGIFAFL